jgi:hypothetical protein
MQTSFADVSQVVLLDELLLQELGCGDRTLYVLVSEMQSSGYCAANWARSFAAAEPADD